MRVDPLCRVDIAIPFKGVCILRRSCETPKNAARWGIVLTFNLSPQAGGGRFRKVNNPPSSLLAMTGA
ncbi:hypothetical protein CKA32_003577 [Geitlerinema sp. FC II]|nr:hypothetical protein CKA32_003577 [Geitlerinema sp. FC II]